MFGRRILRLTLVLPGKPCQECKRTHPIRMQFHSGNGGRTNCDTICLVAKIWHQTGQEASGVLHEVAEELDEMFLPESCDDPSLPRREEPHQATLLILHGGW